MLKIYHVPGTRSVRPLWLCYELNIPVLVEQIAFSAAFRNSPEWRSISPAGKVPVLQDGDLTLFESGAMVEYILDHYGNGQLRPAPRTRELAIYQQWCWFSEATLIRPLGLYRMLRAKNEAIEVLVEEAELKFRDALMTVEEVLSGRDYLLGNQFSAADIMMGYSIVMVERLLDERYPNLAGYLPRLADREAYASVKALEA